jgi:hypothetical protein
MERGESRSFHDLHSAILSFLGSVASNTSPNIYGEGGLNN